MTTGMGINVSAGSVRLLAPTDFSQTQMSKPTCSASDQGIHGPTPSLPSLSIVVPVHNEAPILEQRAFSSEVVLPKAIEVYRQVARL
jgi:hypothetical protein